MTFNNLTEKTNCSCLSGAKEDTTSYFARKGGKQKPLKERDFKNHIERGKEFDTKNDSCKRICGMFGLSVDLWTEESKPEILARYKRTNSYSPKLKNHLFIIKFTPNAGKVKHTPISEPDPNKHHHDFYKSDSFVLASSVEKIQEIPLIQKQEDTDTKKEKENV